MQKYLQKKNSLKKFKIFYKRSCHANNLLVYILECNKCIF